MKQFNLKENRDKLFKRAKKFSANIDEESSIMTIFKFIHDQDKEFIRRLKDGNDMYEIETDEGICGVIDIKKLYDKIDKLSGGL